MIDIQIDSRKIKKGDLFVVLPDNKQYQQIALEKGARKIITNDPTCTYRNRKIVSDPYLYLCTYLKRKYNFENLKIVGVTGTNGKTSTVHIMYQLASLAGKKCAMIGTLGYQSSTTKFSLPNTTPDVCTLYDCLMQASNEQCEYIFMEVSSHGLDQKRIGFLQFEVGVFTNLSLDHLDYHHSMHNYAIAKSKITQHIKKEGFFFYNIDDLYTRYFYFKRSYQYGFSRSDFRILRICQLKDQLEMLFYYKKRYFTSIPFIGIYHAYNSICALGVLVKLGFSIDELLEYMHRLEPIEGRMNSMMIKDRMIVIDFAHTPEAIKKTLESLLEIRETRILSVLGAGGNRDSRKRPVIGSIACAYSDRVIFTSDNPRDEDPDEIIQQMVQTLHEGMYEVIESRSQAIEYALEISKPHDIIVILGKGNETTQIIQGKQIPYSDLEVVLNYQWTEKEDT